MAIEVRDSPVRAVTRVLFQAHASVYLLVNLFLLAIWVLSGAGSFWPMWVIVPWGFGLACHAWLTFGLPAMLNRS